MTDVRFRLWQERMARVLPALGTDGPLTVQPGEIVLVAVVRTHEQAAMLMDAIAFKMDALTSAMVTATDSTLTVNSAAGKR